MTPSEHDRIERLIADLRRTMKAAGDEPLRIESAEASTLADELSRLLQSSRRLRQQNAKLRRRIVRLKGGVDDAGEGGEE